MSRPLPSAPPSVHHFAPDSLPVHYEDPSLVAPDVVVDWEPSASSFGIEDEDDHQASAGLAGAQQSNLPPETLSRIAKKKDPALALQLAELEEWREERTSKRRPWVSICIFAICLGVFAYALYLTPGIIQPLSVNPMIGPGPAALIFLGAKVTSMIIPPSNQWWRLVTANFNHAGVVHILINAIFLLRAGVDLERRAGHAIFTFIYLTSGIVGMAVSALFAPLQITVGASGCLFGVLGALLADLCQNYHFIPTKRDRCCAFSFLIIAILLNVGIGLLPGVDNFAHLGGLFSGLFLGFPLLMRSGIPLGTYLPRQIAWAVVGPCLFIAGTTATFLFLAHGANGAQFCGYCKYLTCVPSPWWSCDDQTV